MKFAQFGWMLCFVGIASLSTGQVTPKDYQECHYWELIEQLRAYEDSIAFELTLPDTLRGEYGVETTDLGVTNRVYRIYRCADLQDTLDRFEDSLAILRAVPPVVDTDSISSRGSTGVTLHAKVTSTGGVPITAQWFRYGTSAANLADSVAVDSTTTPFAKGITGLTPVTQYYFAAFARNAAGLVALGDTLSFWTKCSVDSVVYQSYTYGVVQIGEQCWFDENLRNTYFSDGTTAIATNHTGPQWAALTTTSTPGMAVHLNLDGVANSAGALERYGRLYNWFAVSSPLGLCPSGWHVPSEAAFDSLVAYVGVDAGTKLKALPPLFNGTDDYGFRALPGGARTANGSGLSGTPEATNGGFNHEGSRGNFWTSSVGSPATSSARVTMNTTTTGVITGDLPKGAGFSVRCIQD